jgi:hypothetical protein
MGRLQSTDWDNGRAEKLARSSTLPGRGWALARLRSFPRRFCVVSVITNPVTCYLPFGKVPPYLSSASVRQTNGRNLTGCGLMAIVV